MDDVMIAHDGQEKMMRKGVQSDSTEGSMDLTPQLTHQGAAQDRADIYDYFV